MDEKEAMRKEYYALAKQAARLELTGYVSDEALEMIRRALKEVHNMIWPDVEKTAREDYKRWREPEKKRSESSG